VAVDLSAVRGIYFDLDDTLCAYWDACKIGLRRTFDAHAPDGIDSESCVRAWATAFREFAPTLKETGWYETYLTDSEPTRTEQMRRTLHLLGIDDDDLAVRLSQNYMRERDEALELFADALDVVKALREKFPLGLITNGPADIQRMEVETLGLTEYFDHILIEGEMGEGKPLRSVFDRAASLMGLPASAMLMVGNSYRHDIKAALESGWHAIWISRESDVPPSADWEEKPPTLPKDDLQPDAVIHELCELLPLFGQVERGSDVPSVQDIESAERAGSADA
jgi:putative hydrolase of the HAD superfamily